MSDQLDEYPVRHEQQVTWSELGPRRHVNNACYFNYFDDARHKYFALIGQREFEEKYNIGCIVVSNSCDYISPLSFPDDIAIGASISEIGVHKAVMQFRVLSLSSLKVAANGQTIFVWYDYGKSCKARFPEDLLEQINMIEGKSFSRT